MSFDLYIVYPRKGRTSRDQVGFRVLGRALTDYNISFSIFAVEILGLGVPPLGTVFPKVPLRSNESTSGYRPHDPGTPHCPEEARTRERVWRTASRG